MFSFARREKKETTVAAVVVHGNENLSRALLLGQRGQKDEVLALHLLFPGKAGNKLAIVSLEAGKKQWGRKQELLLLQDLLLWVDRPKCGPFHCEAAEEGMLHLLRRSSDRDDFTEGNRSPWRIYSKSSPMNQSSKGHFTRWSSMQSFLHRHFNAEDPKVQNRGTG